MYAPSTYNSDLYSLWNKKYASNLSLIDQASGPTSALQPQQFRADLELGLHLPHSPGGGSSVDHQSRQLRQLFAPPLVAYSPDYCGANLAYVEYTIQAAAAHFGSVHSGEFMTTGPSCDFAGTAPLLQQKTDQLRAIRDTGYATIRPIGIGKTQHELDAEAGIRRQEQGSSQDDEAQGVTVENQDDAGSGILDSATIYGADLDTQVVDADAHESANEDSELYSLSHDGQGSVSPPADAINMSHSLLLLLLHLQHNYRENLVNEGFMADEVEYQADHSLDESLRHQDSSLISPVYTAFSGGATASTNMTSVHSNPTALECIGEDSVMGSTHNSGIVETSAGRVGSSRDTFASSTGDLGVDENAVIAEVQNNANDSNLDHDHSNIDDSDMVMV